VTQRIANVVSIIDAVQWPRALLRAELIERGFDAVGSIRRLADALESGAPFSIQVAGELLRIPRDAAFNIEHERTSGNHELEFQLRWREE